MRRIHTLDGRFTAEQVRDAVTPRGNMHSAPSTVLCVENTHNGGGGRVWPLAQVREIVAAARELELRIHLDGARLLNAAVASGVPAWEYGREFDTVTLCLSKGLGCPLGALVAGSRERMGKARRVKHLFGGAMRQAGIVAAAGIYALDHHVERLAEDHANASRLGEGLAAAGLPVDPEQIESNFVFLDVGSIGLRPEDVLALLRAEGVLLSLAAPKGVLRALTHLDVTAVEIEQAIESMIRALRHVTGSPPRVPTESPPRAATR